MWGEKRTSIINIPLDSIKPNAYQPRREFDEMALNDLSESIKNYGVLQPIVVRKAGWNEYELIAGERRWRASKLAGLKDIPAIVKDVQDYDTAIMALIENIQRENLNFIEEAEGYKKLMEEYDITQEQLALKLGKSQSTIANKLRILKISPELLKIISREKLTERHARALLKIPDENLQKQVLEQIIENKLTVRETDKLVEKIINGTSNCSQSKKKQKFKSSIKDVRIFVNSVKSIVKSIKELGLDAGYKEVDKGEYIELVVQIPKR